MAKAHDSHLAPKSGEAPAKVGIAYHRQSVWGEDIIERFQRRRGCDSRKGPRGGD
jgi:hypothetical protein